MWSVLSVFVLIDILSKDEGQAWPAGIRLDPSSR
jgi:hypothetical protein